MRWSIIDNQPFFNHAYFCSARRIYPCRVTALSAFIPVVVIAGVWSCIVQVAASGSSVGLRQCLHFDSSTKDALIRKTEFRITVTFYLGMTGPPATLTPSLKLNVLNRHVLPFYACLHTYSNGYTHIKYGP